MDSLKSLMFGPKGTKEPGPALQDHSRDSEAGRGRGQAEQQQARSMSADVPTTASKRRTHIPRPSYDAARSYPPKERSSIGPVGAEGNASDRVKEERPAMQSTASRPSIPPEIISGTTKAESARKYGVDREVERPVETSLNTDQSPRTGPSQGQAEGVYQDHQSFLSRKDADIAYLQEQLDAALGNRSKWEQHARDLEQRLINGDQFVQRQTQDFKSQLSMMERQLEDKNRTLNDRIEELQSAQVFMTTADQYSTVEVTRMVEQLNEDIYQCAAFMVDAVFDARNSRRQMDDQMEVAFANARQEARSATVKRWGETLTNHLEADLTRDETVLVECLVQHMLVEQCHDIISPLFIESRRMNQTLTRVWKGIRDSKGPAVANNWRALAFSQLKATEIDTKPMVDAIGFFMIFCGWRKLAEGVDVPTKVKEKLREMAEKAKRIKEMVFEGVLSTDIQTIYYSSKDQYDTATMLDAHDTGKAEAGKSIICSTSLGVIADTRRRDRSTRKTKTMILKSSVLLVSTLESN